MKNWMISGVVAVSVMGAAGRGEAFLSLENDRSTKPTRVGSAVMPPSGFSGQRWVHPNGCQYSRAGRPGETVWYLVATGKRGCAAYIVQNSPYGDY
ncbi:hypothetical protein [Nereida sp. MMG025]|uniref:hypothetical protein n=1 Tax=Nereida sp. MMG025 TaxID=2909981 RepID=UPI001F29C248|nr:hypothetical protein [Nereida sp. MMG025]MCF6443896.1 hypothetical protein [Nereida sp. MMG025]